MTNNKLTDEQVERWVDLARTVLDAGGAGTPERVLSHGVIALVTELQERRQADNAEPDYIRYDCGCCGWETIEDWRDNDVCPKCNHKPMGKTELYEAPQPAPAVETETAAHKAWKKFQSMLDPSDPAAAPQPEPVVPDEIIDHRDAFEAAFPIPLHAERCGSGYCCTAYNAWGAQKFVNRWEGWNACRAAMLQGADGNSPVIPDGWALVPKEPTPAMLNAAWVSHGIYHASAYRTMLAATPQQEVPE